MSRAVRSLSEAYVDRIVAAAAALPGVETGPHRFAGVEFTLRGRELGHVHAGGTLDVTYPRAIRDALVAAGWTGPHHLFPDSGWTTLRVATDRDVDRAVRLVTLSHLWHARALSRRFDDVTVPGVERTLDRVRAPDAVRRLFAR